MHKNVSVICAASCTVALLSIQVFAAPTSRIPATKAPTSKAPAKTTANKPAAKPTAKPAPEPVVEPVTPIPPDDMAATMTPEELEQMLGGVRMPGGMERPLTPMERLFNPKATEAEFQRELATARAADAPAQILLEAQLLRHLYNDNYVAAADMIPDVEKAMTGFDPDTSQFFNSLQSFQGFLTGLRALDAQRKNDAAGFEKNIKDAFWQSPELGPLYAKWTTEFQNDQAMAKLTLPLDIPLASADGGTRTLRQLIGSNKAVLINVWATWCHFCMEAMPQLPAKAKKLAPQGVALVGMNVGDGTAIAAKVKQDAQLSLPWVVEPEELPYTMPLRMSLLPRMVLVTPEGKVLFNGHPESPKLKQALQKLGVEM